jgi:hypothetical protein
VPTDVRVLAQWIAGRVGLSQFLHASKPPGVVVHDTITRRKVPMPNVILRRSLVIVIVTCALMGSAFGTLIYFTNDRLPIVVLDREDD